MWVHACMRACMRACMLCVCVCVCVCVAALNLVYQSTLRKPIFWLQAMVSFVVTVIILWYVVWW